MEFKTKFNLKDSAWLMYNNKPKEIEISQIKVTQIERRIDIHYNDNKINTVTWLDNVDIREEDLFFTKEELLKSL